MLPRPRASEIESIKSASSCLFAGGRAARGMIGLVGSFKWSAIYQTVPAYLGFVYASFANSTSSGRGVFGSSIFACVVIHSGDETRKEHARIHVSFTNSTSSRYYVPGRSGWPTPFLGPVGGRFPC